MRSTTIAQRICTDVDELLRLGAVTAPPVPVERLARLCGAQVRMAPFEGDISGGLFRSGDSVVIGVNELHARSRQRFTIAHELGHLRLHDLEKPHLDRGFRVAWRDSRSSDGSDLREIEANQYAAELLMPAEMLKHDVGTRGVDYETDELVSLLAKRYRVSVQAMTYRLVNLGYLGPVSVS